MKRLNILGLFLSMFCLIGCDNNKTWKSVTLYNQNISKVYIYKLKGVDFYPDNSGPSKVHLGVIHPKQRAGLKSQGTPKINYPILIEWGYDEWSYKERKSGVAPPKGKIQKILNIKGLESKTLNEEGSLIIVFGKDGKWHLEWLKGNSHLTAQELEKKKWK